MCLRSVTDEDDVIIVSDRGMVIRMNVGQISRTRRATQGVRLINLKGNQSVVTLAIVPHEEEEIVEEKIIQETLPLDKITEEGLKEDNLEEHDEDSEKEIKYPETLFDI